MKKKTICKLAIYSLVVVLLGGGYLYFKSEREKPEKKKPLTTIVADSVYDLTKETDDIEEEELSESEVITNAMINGEEDFRNEDDVMTFFRQLETQAREYVDNYNLKRSQEGIENIWIITYNFSIKKEMLHGWYVGQVSNDNYILLYGTIFPNIRDMYIYKVSPEHLYLIEVGDIVKNELAPQMVGKK